MKHYPKVRTTTFDNQVWIAKYDYSSEVGTSDKSEEGAVNNLLTKIHRADLVQIAHELLCGYDSNRQMSRPPAAK